MPCSGNYYPEVHIKIRLWEDWNGRSWKLAQSVNLVMLALAFLVHSSRGHFMERKGHCLKETQVSPSKATCVILSRLDFCTNGIGLLLVKFEAWEASRYFMILIFQISNFKMQGLALQKIAEAGDRFVEYVKLFCCHTVASGCQWRLASWLCMERNPGTELFCCTA